MTVQQPPTDLASRAVPLWVFPILAGTLLLAACGAGDEDVGPSVSDLAGRQFVATSVTGHQLTQPELVTVAFVDDGRDGTAIESTGGCNDSTSAFSIEDGRLRRTGDRTTTAAGCDQVRLDQDDWLDGWLDRDPRLTLDDDRLTLADEGVRIELREQVAN